MKIGLLRAKCAGTLGRLIDAFSGGGGFCHAELLWDSDISYTAQPFSGTNYSRHVHRPQNWVVYDLPYCDDGKIRMWCDSEVGCEYNFAGVMHFVFPFMAQNPKKWFCSEVVVAALQKVGMFPREVAWRISPNKLKKILDQAGIQQTTRFPKFLEPSPET